MSLDGKRVLVTGAGGFIGSHLTERLVELGARTRALVRYTSSGSWGWLDSSPLREDVEVMLGDVRDADSLQSAVHGVDVVFHLAALIGIPYSYQAPLSYVRTNVEGTLNVLQTSQAAGVGRVITTSTSEVYGTALRVPIDEDHPLQGQSPYSASKIAADKMAEAFHRSFGAAVAVIRPFNTYGPRQSARAVIPTIVVQALTREKISLGSLSPRRDFNYVADTVEGFVRMATSSAVIGEVVNLGSGRDISVGELATAILSILDRDLPIEQTGERTRPDASEVERLIADAGKADRLMGWRPSWTLKDGLRATVQWIEKNMDHYRPDVYAV